MILRDNYFGSFTHFSTLKEYIQRMDRKQPLGDPIGMQYREGSVSPDFLFGFNMALITMRHSLTQYKSSWRSWWRMV